MHLGFQEPLYVSKKNGLCQDSSLYRDVQEKRKRSANKHTDWVRKEKNDDEQKEDTVLIEKETGSLWDRE